MCYSNKLELDKHNISMKDLHLKSLPTGYIPIVISISPQALSSLALFLKYSNIDELFDHLALLFKSIGVYYVVDTSSVDDIVLLESAEEFIHRYVSYLEY